MQFKAQHQRVESDTIAGSAVIEPLLDSEAAAKILGVSTSWMAKGRVYGYGPDFIEIGRTIRYSPSGLLRYAAARNSQTVQQKKETKDRKEGRAD